MNEIVIKLLRHCHLLFPDYRRTEDDLPALADIFSAFLAKYDESAVAEAFSRHVETSQRFPVPADILDLLKPCTVYRMDYGPNGIGALYDANHPYVRLQVRLGENISRYSEKVSNIKAQRLRLEASTASKIDLGEDDYPAIQPRAGSGFRRLSFSEWPHRG